MLKCIKHDKCFFVVGCRPEDRGCDSVSQWLVDLRTVTETECMCVLQGKSLTKESTDVIFTSLKSLSG